MDRKIYPARPHKWASCTLTKCRKIRNLIGQKQGIGLQGAISLLKKLRGEGFGDVCLALNNSVLYKTDQDKHN